MLQYARVTAFTVSELLEEENSWIMEIAMMASCF